MMAGSHVAYNDRIDGAAGSHVAYNAVEQTYACNIIW